MIDRTDLVMFLSELTALSRKYGIKIVDATRGCAEQVILVPFESEEDKRNFYLVENNETLMFEPNADNYKDAITADELFIVSLKF